MTSPRLPSSLHRRLGSARADAGDVERAPSRDGVLVPTGRRRPCPACAVRLVGACEGFAMRAVVRQDTYYACPTRCFAGSASFEPAPATPNEYQNVSESSCRLCAADLVMRAPIVLSTHARAVPCTSPCVGGYHRFFPLRCIAVSTPPEPALVTPSGRQAASGTSCRPSATDLVVRVPIVSPMHTYAVLCAPPCVG